MRTNNPEQFTRDEYEARAFAWDPEPIDTGNGYCESCDCELTDANTSTEDVVCIDCLESFCRKQKGEQ